MTTHRTRSRSLSAVFDWCRIGFFSVGIGVPIFCNLVYPDGSPTWTEMRNPTTWADVIAVRGDPTRFARRLHRFASDQLGFRNTLVRWNALGMVYGLGVSSSDEVLLGESGWAYLRGDGALDGYRALHPYSERDLGRMSRLFERRHRWLAERGIRFLVVAAPDKFSVYPEHVPRRVARARGPSRLDQLAAYLAAHSEVEFLDLRPALLSAKGRGRLYYRLDTHWSDLGAWFANRAILERLGGWYPRLTPRPLTDFRVFETPAKPAELGLARMLGLSGVLVEGAVRVRPRFWTRAVEVASGRPLREAGLPMIARRFETRSAGAPGPRTLILRDSFGTGLAPFLAEQLRVAHWEWPSELGFGARERARIAQVAPDLVIELFLERALQRPVGAFEASAR